jgi:integrase
LLNITDKNIKDIKGVKIIELKQQKTGKLVAIPLLPEALEIVESGLPRKISLEHFNQYSKDICEIAEIDAIVKGKMRIDDKRTLTAGYYKKWQVISSHVCRRSFATNFYGRIPTSVLMNITAHGTESVFLKYIGKTTYDNAYQMLEYFSKLANNDKTSVIDLIEK